LYLLLNAAFGQGPLSAPGRRRLAACAVLVGADLSIDLFALTPFGRTLLGSVAAGID
jgi:hypothetical protein